MESDDKGDAKRRSRRRRSIRNLKDGLPGMQQSESADGCLGSLWLEAEEPVRKRKKRRSSLFTGLPAFHSTPLREESLRLDTSDVTREQTEHNAAKDTGQECEVDRLGSVDGRCRSPSDSQTVGCEASSWEKPVLAAPENEDEAALVCNRSLNGEMVSSTHTIEKFPDINSSLSTEIKVNAEEHNESISLSSPEVSLTKISPCSMSPDFPASPVLVPSLTNHGESFIESDTFITGVHVRSNDFGAARTKHKSDILIDSISDLNSSNKENVSQNLDVTPAGLQNDDSNKVSPGFFSLCKTLAGKVVTFVKTSPNYLTNAIMTSNTPPSVLKEAADEVDNGANLVDKDHTVSAVRLAHDNSKTTTHKNETIELKDLIDKDHTAPADRLSHDNSINNRQQLHDKINETLEEMEEQIFAEKTPQTTTHESRTTEMKDFTKLVKPILYNDDAKPTGEKSSDNRPSTKSTCSLKKKRDRTVFDTAFKAMNNMYNEDDADSGDGVFGSKAWLKVPRAPERPSSRSSLTNDAEFMDKLMQEGAGAGPGGSAVEVGQSESGTTGADTGDTRSEHDTRLPAPEQSSGAGNMVSCSSAVVETPPVEKSFQSLFLPLESVEEHPDLKENVREKETDTDPFTKCSEAREMATDETETADGNQAIQAASEDISTQDQDTGKDLVDYYGASTYIQTAASPKDIVASKCDIDLKVQPATLEEPENLAKSVVNVPVIKEEIISQANIDVTATSSVVSKRKRKHQMPVKAYTEKTSITEVLDTSPALEVRTEDTSAGLAGQKKVKSKSVAAKRRSGQFSVLPAIPSAKEKEQELVKCSGPKRKKVSVPSDQSDISEAIPSETKNQESPSTTIEERISMLAIEGSGDYSKASSKPKAGVKKRRRSAKFNVIVDAKTSVSEARLSNVDVIEAPVGKHQDDQGDVIPKISNTTDVKASISEPHIDILQDVAPQSETAVKPKGRGRRRRSATFKDIAAFQTDLANSQKDQAAGDTEDSPQTAMEVSKITKDISQVNLKETKSPADEPVESQEITVDNLELPEDTCNVVPKRRRRRSAESATLKIQMYSEGLADDSPRASSSPNVGPVTTIKPGKKRKLDSKISEEELEKLYKNKNFVKPDERKPWQTIFESPGTSGDLYGKKRLQRFIEFEKPTQMKLRRRLQRAVKNGWDPKKKKRVELKDEVVELKLAALQEELDESSDSLTEKLKTIVETQ